MSDILLVGVDGGGTKCRVRVRRLDGTFVSEAEGGTANVFAGIDAAVGSVVDTVRAALQKGGLESDALGRCHAGLGLAGANIPSLVETLHARPLPFGAFRVETDAVTACRGAFGGEDGAVAILGTGTAYAVRAVGVVTLLGGWGMVVSDQGSGADLGRRALAAALLALDRVLPRAGLCEALLDHFMHRPDAVAEFARTALPRDFGRFAPLVWDHARLGDPVAERLLAESLATVEPMLRRMLDLGAPALALLGGMADNYRRRIPADLAAHVVDPLNDAMEGGIDLARSIDPARGNAR